MKTMEELEAFCSSDILIRTLDEINEWQRRTIRKFWTPLCIFLVLLTALGVVFFKVPHAPEWLYGVLIVGGAGALTWFVIQICSYSTEKRQRYKSGIVEPCVRYFDPELSYFPDQKIAESIYKQSGLYSQHYDKYKGEDLVSGKYHSIPVQFSQLHTLYETRDKDGHTHTHDIFKGIFFIAEFNKNFKTRIMILPDVAENIFGQWLGNALQKMNLFQPGKLCKMEDPEFEKAFAVYGDDDIETRYVLSPSLMRRMLDLRARLGLDLRFSFCQSSMILAISKTEDIFECGMFERLNPQSVKRPVMQLASILLIVEELSLETRIWSKS